MSKKEKTKNENEKSTVPYKPLQVSDSETDDHDQHHLQNENNPDKKEESSDTKISKEEPQKIEHAKQSRCGCHECPCQRCNPRWTEADEDDLDEIMAECCLICSLFLCVLGPCLC